MSWWTSLSVRKTLSHVLGPPINYLTEWESRWLFAGLSAGQMLLRSRETELESLPGFRSATGGCVPEHSCRVSYLVDPASSHMLVSKIKPCMSKYKPH